MAASPTAVTATRAEAVGRNGFHNDMLPPWRLSLRSLFLKAIHAEQPLLIWLQKHYRTPNRDLFFTYTTNLGTHTFFLLTIPVLFWCGFAEVGRGLAIVMTLGVFMTGLAKDLLCLPRPLSPPIHQLTFSKSHQLEYGFPSTHTANAVSIGLFLLAQIDQRWPYDPQHWVINVDRLMVQALVWLYMTSVSFGRLYCGMHGLVDVGAGFVIGISVYEFWYRCWSAIELWTMSSGLIVPISVIALCIGLIVLHPDPAEPCPCIDDSIAVIAVDMGLLIATWHYPQMMPYVTPQGSIPFNYAKLGLVGSIARIVLGVLIVFTWRLAVKYTCYKVLPPLYRAGRFPYRKFYTPASSYTYPPSSEIERCPSIINVPSKVVDRMGTSEVDVIRSNSDLHQRQHESNKKQDTLTTNTNNSTIQMTWTPKPRYDIDIVTKIVVYAGVGWWAMEGVPLLFPYIGLN
ncbi:phosphatidic acid phosphatase type 2/haloperoxidase [Syncephalis fuscata]|nr:phosphatidic acid phosphatase type 2/haloperoxidase [Syncephalis fuscata]